MQDARVEAQNIEALLTQHPEVKAAAVVVGEDSSELISYVVPELRGLTASGQSGTKIVNRWRKLYDVTYSTAPVAPSFTGWNSSYTREPIPETEMREWLDATLERIRALKPRRCLEIGCGVGLLLQDLAPQCERYVGLDLSPAALTQLQHWIGQREELRHVELMHRAAHELDDVPDGSFDTVLLNSVIQYFPDIEYLLAVIRNAVRLLAPGGKLFIGDVRNLRLLESFHCAVQLSRADGSVSATELRRRVVRAMSQEIELVVDPELFELLVGEMSGIAAADVRMKRGQARNELTCYRYDVVLEKGDGTLRAAKSRPWNVYANSPSENSLGQNLILRLRSHLAERVPEQRVPSAWTILNELPLAHDGGVNRSVL